VRWLESLAAEAISLDAYLREIARFPELTSSEERDLSKRVKRRDGDALGRLVASQLALVLRYARQYDDLGLPLADLVHDGNLALVDAARRFDPDRHGRFGAYALWWVRQGILHRLSQATSAGIAADVETRAASLATALRVIVEQACGPRRSNEGARRAEPGPDPDVPWRLTPELEHLDDDELDLDDVGALLIDEGEGPVREASASELGLSLLELEPKERQTLELRLGLVDGEPRTVNQTGDRLRISPARVEHLSARAVQKLRRQRSVRSPLN
jgi:RNA polymerase primary sigma factor